MNNQKLAVGQPVEVRTRFTREWAGGFRVAETTDEGYRIARVSDGQVLGALFQPNDVVPASSRFRHPWELH